MTLHPLAVLLAVALGVGVCRFLLWLVEASEPSNYERDEIPPPPSNVIALTGRTVRLGSRKDLQ